MADSTGRYTRTFDALDRTHSSTNPALLTLTFVWDPVGERSALIDPAAGRTTYAYDAAKQLKVLKNSLGQITSYSYDAAGRRTLKKLANGTRASFAYDAADRMIVVNNLKSTSAIVSSFTYLYDRTTNRTGLVEFAGDRITWTYDATYQLLGENRTGTPAYRHTFLYDDAGNRVRKTEDGAVTTFAYDAANRPRYSATVSGRTTYSYDAAGNQREVLDPSLDRLTNTWDFENRNTRVALASGDFVTFAYNSYHWRVERQDDAGTRKYVYDQDQLLWETDPLDMPVFQYTQEVEKYGNLVSRYDVTGTDTAYYHYDALGSTSALTDDSQVVGDTYEYQAFGEIAASTGTSDNPFQWVGELGYEYDFDLDRHHLRRRDYKAELGKFLSDDPLGFEAGDTNISRYVENNPANLTDPSGLCTYGVSRIVFVNQTSNSVQAYNEGGINCKPCQPCMVWFVEQNNPNRGAYIGKIDEFTGEWSDDLHHTITLKGGEQVTLRANVYNEIKPAHSPCIMAPDASQRLEHNMLDAHSSDYEVNCWFLKKVPKPCELPENPDEVFWCELIASFTGIQGFCDALGQLQGGYQAVVNAYKQGRLTEVIGNLLTGAYNGLSDLFKDLYSHLRDGVADWIGVSREVFTFDYANANFGTLVKFVIEKVFQIDWKTSLKELLGPGLANVVLGIVDAIKQAPDFIQKIKDAISGEIDLVAQLVAIGTSELKARFLGILAPVVTNLIAKLIPGVGIFKSIYDFVLWLKSSGEKATVLMGKVGTLLQVAVAGGPNVLNAIAKGILDFAKNNIQYFFDSVAKILGIPDSLKDKVKNLVCSIREKIKSFFLSLFCPAAKQLRALWQEIIKKFPSLKEKFGDGGGSCPVVDKCDKKAPPQNVCGNGNCLGAGTRLLAESGWLPVEAIPLGARLGTYTARDVADLGVQARQPAEWEDARIVKLLVTKPEGGSMEAELLRGQGWIEQHRATVGEHVFLNLPELGIETEALVIAIEAGPELDEEEEADAMPQVAIGGTRFRRVTGRFRHSSGELLLLQLVGAAEPIRITAGHLLWSDTARDWVAVSELRPGDRLRTLDGPGIVELITPCPTPQPVYNLEIDGDHVYRVGNDGVLVHNMSDSDVRIKECCGDFNSKGGDEGGGPAPSEGIMVRRGKGRESINRLSKRAAEAASGGSARNGVLYGYGVSVTSEKSNQKLSKDPLDISVATRAAFESVGFQLRYTPTKNDCDHHTVQLPQPLTDTEVQKFNKALGR